MGAGPHLPDFGHCRRRRRLHRQYWCKFAGANTKDTALATIDYLKHRVALDQPVNIHFTGCSHSCAQHYAGDIGLMGVPLADGEGFNITLGGGMDQAQGIGREVFWQGAARKYSAAPRNKFSGATTPGVRTAKVSWISRAATMRKPCRRFLDDTHSAGHSRFCSILCRTARVAERVPGRASLRVVVRRPSTPHPKRET